MNEEISPVLPKKNNSKYSLALGVLSLVTIALFIAINVYLYFSYLPNFTQGEENSAAGLALIALIPLLVGFTILSGISVICLLVLAILYLKNQQNAWLRTKGLLIATIVLDIIVAVGMVLVAILRPSVDIFFLVSAIYMLIYLIFKIVALTVCKNAKEK